MTLSPARTCVWCAALMLPVFGAPGCSSEGGASHSIDYELFDTTHELDEQTLAALMSINEDQSELIFVGSTPTVDAVAPGEVLLAGATETTPRGMLRRVLTVTRAGGETRVTTEPTTVFHAFRRLNVELAQPLRVDAPMRIPPPAPTGPGVAIAPLTLEHSIGVEDEPIELFDGDDNDATTEDRVAGTGTLLATVRIHFWLHFDWEDLTPAEALGELDDIIDQIGGLLTGDIPGLAQLLNLRTGLTLEGEFDAALDLTGRASRHYERDLPLGTIPLPDVPIGPLLFTPSLSLDARFTGSVSGAMSLGIELGADATLGFEYDADEGVSPIVSGPHFTQQIATPQATVSAALHGELDLSLRFPLYGFFGPYVGIGPSLDADVDRTRTPCFRLSAGLEGKSGAWLGVFDRTLARIEGPSFPIGDSFELASGACAPLPDPPVTDALITPWSRSYSDTAWSTGTDDDDATLERAHDGRLLATMSTGSALLKVEEDGTLVWARTFDQPDRPGFTTLHPALALPTVDTGVLVVTREGVLVKLSASGEHLWAAALSSDNAEVGYVRAAELVGTETWLAGTHRAEGSSDRQALLTVFAADGTVVRAWTWGSPDYDEVIRDVLAVDGGVLLVGEARSTTVDSRSFVMKVGVDGTLLWARHVQGCAGATEPLLATGIETHDGDLILGGWHYATTTRALLLRLPADGSGASPAWVSSTTVPLILGLEPRTLHQLETGELRVTGRFARSGGDELFAAGTDSIGRFAWLRWYGGAGDQGPPASIITAQGGLLLASSSATVEPVPGSLWLLEVPNPNGEITFRADSNAVTEPLAFTTTVGCLELLDAALQVVPHSLGLNSVQVVTSAAAPVVTDRAL
ncbi:MAG: hypothetical protein IPG81_00965 [Sandaracinaceae bacterium]|nr:hypothetical protein [Sandaracinaceae bacterium]